MKRTLNHCLHTGLAVCTGCYAGVWSAAVQNEIIRDCTPVACTSVLCDNSHKPVVVIAVHYLPRPLRSACKSRAILPSVSISAESAAGQFCWKVRCRAWKWGFDPLVARWRVRQGNCPERTTKAHLLAFYFWRFNLYEEPSSKEAGTVFFMFRLFFSQMFY